MTIAGSPRPQFIKDGFLQPGDIVLTTTPAKLSASIRKFTGADISHAMLCVAGGSVIDSTSEGVHARNLQWMAVEQGCGFHLLRAATPLTPQQLDTVIRHARQQIAMPYTKVGAMQSLSKKGKVTRHQFCSRLVAQAYREAGIHLVLDADRCTPAELLRSPLLVEIPDVLHELSQAEEAARARHNDRTQLMRDVTTALIAGARKISSSIETVNDIDEHLKQHPESDAAMCEVLVLSGYLDVWRGEEVRNPWQYSVEQMDLGSHAGMHQYCLDTLFNETVGTHRYVENRAGYCILLARFSLTYFGLMVELYSNVAAQHMQRLQTAANWMVKHGYMTKDEERHLRPHTPEWFQSLRDWDPVQAAMTEHLIQAADSSEICSTCGDDPALDYVLAQSTLAGPSSIRLCSDCHGRRSRDEPMTPFPEQRASRSSSEKATVASCP